jgi:hypothetical protein
MIPAPDRRVAEAILQQAEDHDAYNLYQEQKRGRGATTTHG